LCTGSPPRPFHHDCSGAERLTMPLRTRSPPASQRTHPAGNHYLGSGPAATHWRQLLRSSCRRGARHHGDDPDLRGYLFAPGAAGGARVSSPAWPPRPAAATRTRTTSSPSRGYGAHHPGLGTAGVGQQDVIDVARKNVKAATQDRSLLRSPLQVAVAVHAPMSPVCSQPPSAPRYSHASKPVITPGDRTRISAVWPAKHPAASSGW